MQLLRRAACMLQTFCECRRGHGLGATQPVVYSMNSIHHPSAADVACALKLRGSLWHHHSMAHCSMPRRESSLLQNFSC
jgi:hypothetical protein